jgi:hypothetical protein
LRFVKSNFTFNFHREIEILMYFSLLKQSYILVFFQSTSINFQSTNCLRTTIQFEIFGNSIFFPFFKIKAKTDFLYLIIFPWKMILLLVKIKDHIFVYYIQIVSHKVKGRWQEVPKSNNCLGRYFSFPGNICLYLRDISSLSQ